MVGILGGVNPLLSTMRSRGGAGLLRCRSDKGGDKIELVHTCNYLAPGAVSTRSAQLLLFRAGPHVDVIEAIPFALTQRSAFGYWLSIAMTATPIATTVTIAPTGPP